MKIAVAYKPSFIRQFNKLEAPLQDEVAEKVELLKDTENHQKLKVHKLHGLLKEFYSFSVNYRYRIVFSYQKNKAEAVLRTIGDHKIYDSGRIV